MNAEIDSLEKRLSLEDPTFVWHCTRVPLAAPKAKSASPGEIEIHVHVRIRGTEATGSPLFLSENMLQRWGVDSTARLISQKFQLALQPHRRRMEPDWDRLADV